MEERKEAGRKDSVGKRGREGGEGRDWGRREGWKNRRGEGRKPRAVERNTHELTNSRLLLKEVIRLCVTMETGTGQNYDAGTGITSTDEHLRIERCHCTYPVSFQMHGKGQIFASHQPSLDGGEFNKLDEDV